MNKVIKYLLLALLGVVLGAVYSFIIKQSVNVETIVVFVALYVYFIVFIKFLIRLFR